MTTRFMFEKEHKLHMLAANEEKIRSEKIYVSTETLINGTKQ